MRLGTRWAFGDEPPASVPGDLRPRIAAAEVGHGGVAWITADDNATAQQLYDRIAKRTSWVTYEMGA